MQGYYFNQRFILLDFPLSTAEFDVTDLNLKTSHSKDFIKNKFSFITKISISNILYMIYSNFFDVQKAFIDGHRNTSWNGLFWFKV